jgi:hypothetical protein
VRFVQLYHWGWDSHGTGTDDDLMHSLPALCKATDQASAALIKDLKQRGLLDDTLVIWGGEFGRTPMNEARGGSTFLGRIIIRGRSRSGWRAPGSSRASRTGRLTNLATTLPRTGARPRFSGDGAALFGFGSQTADVSLPGPRFSVDRCFR